MSCSLLSLVQLQPPLLYWEGNMIFSLEGLLVDLFSPFFFINFWPHLTLSTDETLTLTLTVSSVSPPSSTLLSPLPPPTISMMLGAPLATTWLLYTFPRSMSSVQASCSSRLPCFVNASLPPLSSYRHRAWQPLRHPCCLLIRSCLIFYSGGHSSIPLPRPASPFVT